MKVFVTAKPGAKIAKIERVGGDGLFETSDAIHLKVAIKEPATDGRANAAIVKAVAEYFHTAPSHVRIVSGQSGRRKILEISDMGN